MTTSRDPNYANFVAFVVLGLTLASFVTKM